MNIQGFRNYGYAYGDLTGQSIEDLEEFVKKTRESKEYYHGRSVVNIEEQYKVDLESVPESYAEYISQFFQGFEDDFGYIQSQFPQSIAGSHILGRTPTLTFIDNLRVVCQKSGEYHAPIRNEGTHSFITFLEVPYDYDEEIGHSSYSRKLQSIEIASQGEMQYPPFSTDTSGSLSFIYTHNGGISTEPVTIDPYSEGKTFIFPASTIYYINPFYTSDKPLVYLQGSIGFQPLVKYISSKDEKSEDGVQDNPNGEEKLLENPDKGDENNFFE